MGERYQLLEAGATKPQWIAMKFGMFFIGSRENALSIDDLAQGETYFFVTTYWTASAVDQPLTDQDCPRYRH